MPKVRKFRKLKTLREYVQNPAASLWEVGEAIHQFWAKGSRLHTTIFKHQSFYWAWPWFRINWQIAYGLSDLLHEIGHYRLIRQGRDGTESAFEVYYQEAEAWIWAEVSAYALGVHFDYAHAEMCLETYRVTRKLTDALKPRWRHKED